MSANPQKVMAEGPPTAPRSSAARPALAIAILAAVIAAVAMGAYAIRRDDAAIPHADPPVAATVTHTDEIPVTSPASPTVAVPVTPSADALRATSPASPTATTVPPASDCPTVLVFGDSLSAAYNIDRNASWTARIAERLAQRRPSWCLVNASISGETTGGGAARIAAALRSAEPEIVIVELGANDGLRGLPLDAAQANLEQIIDAARAAGAEVLVTGMRLPPNYGPEYTGQFSAMFEAVSSGDGTTLLPFLLEPIATDRSAFQADNLHPTAAAQPALADHLWPSLEPLLNSADP